MNGGGKQPMNRRDTKSSENTNVSKRKNTKPRWKPSIMRLWKRSTKIRCLRNVWKCRDGRMTVDQNHDTKKPASCPAGSLGVRGNCQANQPPPLCAASA